MVVESFFFLMLSSLAFGGDKFGNFFSLLYSQPCTSRLRRLEFFLRLPYAQLFQISLGSAVRLVVFRGLTRQDDIAVPLTANVAFHRARKRSREKGSCHCQTSDWYATNNRSFLTLGRRAANAIESGETAPSLRIVP